MERRVGYCQQNFFEKFSFPLTFGEFYDIILGVKTKVNKMSRTYKYPRESSDTFFRRDEPMAELRIKEKLKRQKKQQRIKVKMARLKRVINFRKMSARV